MSAYSDLYDLIIPKENLLRKINELIDFTFIHDELVSKYCSNNGRNAESPIRMFKNLLLKTIYTISDVDVVERSQHSSKRQLKIKPLKVHGVTMLYRQKITLKTDRKSQRISRKDKNRIKKWVDAPDQENLPPIKSKNRLTPEYPFGKDVSWLAPL